MRIFIDLDGVVADFDKACAGKDPVIFKMLKDTYVNLEPIEGAINAVRTLISSGYDVWFATKIPSYNTSAAAEKLFWVSARIPEMVVKTIITPNKGLLVGDYLIDDRPHKAHCEDFKGTLIHFGSVLYPNWESVLSLFTLSN